MYIIGAQQMLSLCPENDFPGQFPPFFLTTSRVVLPQNLTLFFIKFQLSKVYNLLTNHPTEVSLNNYVKLNNALILGVIHKYLLVQVSFQCRNL